jgi:orotate phosphoribosyltransferase
MSSYEIAEALIAIQGVGFKPRDPITFKSGIKSPVYCDNRKFPFHPEQWAKVIHGFERLVEEKQIPLDVVGGIEAAEGSQGPRREEACGGRRCLRQAGGAD